jgi:hypothetical protein
VKVCTLPSTSTAGYHLTINGYSATRLAPFV